MKTKAELQDELQAKALQAIGERRVAGVGIGTGGGKTMLGIKHMLKQYSDTAEFIVAAPRVSILKEWKSQIKDAKLDFLLDHITFTSYRSLTKQSDRVTWIYLDECHSLKYSHEDYLERCLLNKCGILGLSGTYPTYKGSEKGKMCNDFCPLVFEYNVDEGIEDGILNDYVVYIHMLQLSNLHTVVKKKKDGTEWRTSELKDYAYYTNAIMNAPNDFMRNRLEIGRMKAIQSYRTKIEYIKKIMHNIPYKTLIFMDTKAQADEVCKHSYHSSNKKSEENLELFAQNKIKYLSCVDQLSEGKNIPDLRAGIISHSYSNERKARQKLGRFLRLNPNDKAIVHILCYENSVDLKWVMNSIKQLDQSKIKIYRP